jgi:hypothetical protein
MMKALVPVLSAFAALLPGGTGQAATKVDCHALFQNADHNSDGSVGGAELLPFVPSLMAAGLTAQSIEQKVIKFDEFTENCMKDQFKDMQPPQ